MIKKQKNRYYRLMIICLLLSIVSWFAVKMSKDYTQTYQIAVSFVNLPEKKNLTYQSDSLITITLNAKGLDLLKYEMADKHIAVNYSDIITTDQQTRNYVTIKNSQLNSYILQQLKFPNNIIVEELSGITLELEPEKETI